MAALKQPHGYTIFCDDVRQEIGGKISLIGIYSSNLIVHSEFPVTLPKFVMAVSYIEPREFAASENLIIRAYLPGDNEDHPSAQAEVSITKAKEENGQVQPDHLVNIRAFIMLSPMTIKETGKIKVRAIRNNETIKLGTLRIDQVFPN
jgi:hypothetical protein